MSEEIYQSEPALSAGHLSISTKNGGVSMMGRFAPHTLRHFLIAGAIFACSGISAVASSISATAFGGQSIGTQQNTGVPNQLVSLGSPSGPFFEEALTDYGVNKALATSKNAGLFTQAQSVWSVDFTLSETGQRAGTTIPISIHYMFDANIGVFGSGRDIGATFGYFLDGASSNSERIFGITAQTAGTPNFEICPSRTSNSNPPQGFCAGGYSADNTVTTNIFTVGPFNRLTSSLGVNASDGLADAFSTARLLGIIVPNDVTWTYGPGITGNPLNFQFAPGPGPGPGPGPSPVPEPATWGLMAAGIGTFVFIRRRRTILSCRR